MKKERNCEIAALGRNERNLVPWTKIIKLSESELFLFVFFSGFIEKFVKY